MRDLVSDVAAEARGQRLADAPDREENATFRGRGGKLATTDIDIDIELRCYGAHVLAYRMERRRRTRSYRKRRFRRENGV